MFVLIKKNFFSFISCASLVILALKIYPTYSAPVEYLYPVGYDTNQQQFYLLYQSDLNQLKLWSWDPEIKTAFPATLSSFNPAAFQFLPDQSGFAFIDHGLIRIKNYDHRLVKTIELYAPLINLNSIRWQTPEICFFCAQSHNNYGIFKADLTHKIPQITTLLWTAGIDYLYPQIVELQLFCIKRDHKQHSILKFELNSDLKSLASEPMELFATALDSGLNLKFLQLVDQLQGYFLSQVPARSSQLVSFDCYSLQILNTSQVNQAVQSKFLFSFDLPKAYFSYSKNSGLPDLRLHESILPFLPKYTATKIYFCDHKFTSGNNPQVLDLRVNLFSYDLVTAQVLQLTQAQANQVFCGALILPNGQIYYGGNALDITKVNLTKSELNQQLAHTTVPIALDDEWGLPKIELPLL